MRYVTPVLIWVLAVPAAAAPVCSSVVPKWAVALTEDSAGDDLKCTGAVVATSSLRDKCRVVVATAEHCFEYVTMAWVGPTGRKSRTSGHVRFTETRAAAKDLSYFEIEVDGVCSGIETLPVSTGKEGDTFAYFHAERTRFCAAPYSKGLTAAINNSGGALTDRGALAGVLSGNSHGGLQFARGTEPPPLERLAQCRSLDATTCLDRFGDPKTFKIGTTKAPNLTKAPRQ